MEGRVIRIATKEEWSETEMEGREKDENSGWRCALVCRWGDGRAVKSRWKRQWERRGIEDWINLHDGHALHFTSFPSCLLLSSTTIDCLLSCPYSLFCVNSNFTLSFSSIISFSFVLSICFFIYLPFHVFSHLVLSFIPYLSLLSPLLSVFSSETVLHPFLLSIFLLCALHVLFLLLFVFSPLHAFYAPLLFPYFLTFYHFFFPFSLHSLSWTPVFISMLPHNHQLHLSLCALVSVIFLGLPVVVTLWQLCANLITSSLWSLFDLPIVANEGSRRAPGLTYCSSYTALFTSATLSSLIS